MNLAHCKYHPLDTANFHCEYCQTEFCDLCVDESPLTQNATASRKCVLCDGSVNELEHTADIEPFWRNLNSVYLYPLSKPGIVTLVLLSLLSSIVPNSFILFFFSAVLLIHYASTCLSVTSNGIMEPPVIDDFFQTNISALINIFIVIFIMSVVITMVEKVLGQSIALLAMIFFIVTFPASIIILSIDKKLSNAVNPIKLTAVVKATGISYFLMCLFALIMFSSIVLINEFIISDNPTFINYFLTGIITAYYVVIIFHLMGYIVYQNRHNLSFSVSNTQKDVVIRDDKKRNENHIELLIKNGQYIKAADICLSLLRNENVQLWEWNRCFKLTLLRQEKKKIISFLNHYFEKLNESNQIDLMTEAYLKSIKRLNQYQPESHSVWLNISRGLVEIGHYKTTISLLKDFHKNCENKNHAIDGYELLSKSFENVSGFEKHAQQTKKLASMLKG